MLVLRSRFKSRARLEAESLPREPTMRSWWIYIAGSIKGAVVRILNQIYEEDFVGFSYGFRPGRSQQRCFGCAAGRAHAEEGELDSRCRRSWLFRQPVPPVAGQVRRASGRRSEDTAPDPEVVEGGSIRGRRVVEDGSGDSTRISSLTAAGEHLPALRYSTCGSGTGVSITLGAR